MDKLYIASGCLLLIAVAADWVLTLRWLSVRVHEGPVGTGEKPLDNATDRH